MTMAPRSCSSASTSATTPPSPRTASATPAGNGSPATSTAASCDSPNRSRCSSANSTATTSPDSYSASTASGTTSSSARLRPGRVQLIDAIARWWVLDDDHRARRRESSLWSSTGHAAAVCGDELYDILPQTRGGYGRLQDFGIRFGYERVVLHLEPQVDAGRLQCNTARTLLLLDHEPLPWARWGEEFAAAIPDEILQLQERAASADAMPRQEAIRDRVTAILPLYQLSRYRPPRPPTPRSGRANASSTTVGRASRQQAGREASGAPITDPVRAPADPAATHDQIGEQHSGDEPGSRPMADLPDVAWISARDGSAFARGSREPGRPLPPRPTRADDQRRLPRDQRPDQTLAQPLPRHTRGKDSGRSAGAGMVRTDPRRGRARGPQLDAGATSSSTRCCHRPHSLPPCCQDTCCTQRFRSDSAKSSEPQDEIRAYRRRT